MRSLITLALSVLLGPSALAADRYYLVMLAYDARPAALESGHTFVAFIKEQDDRFAESSVISWLPTRDGGRDFRALGDAEPAFNADLETTLRLARENQRPVSYWEPIEIDRDLYVGGRDRVAYLKNTPVQFRLFDREAGALFGQPTATVGTAVNDLTAANVMEARNFGFLSGRSASQALLEHFGPLLFDERTTHPEILARIPAGKTTLGRLLTGASAQDVWNLEVRRH